MSLADDSSARHKAGESGSMRLPVRRISSAAITVAGLSALLAVALIGTGRVGWVSALISLTAVVYLAVALVGAAILRTRPGSRTGWIFLVSGTAAPIGAALAASADVSGGAAPWLTLASTPFFVLGVPLMATFGILLFPDRGLVTRDRRLLARVYAGELLVLLIWGLFSTNAVDRPGVGNPIAQPWADGLVLSILVLGPLSLFACVSLLRFARRAEGDDAPALRAAARVAFVVPVAYLACVVAGFTTGDTAPISVLENCAAIALGVAAWVGHRTVRALRHACGAQPGAGLRQPERRAGGGLPGRGGFPGAVRRRPGAAGGGGGRGGARGAAAARSGPSQDQPVGVRAARRSGGRLRTTGRPAGRGR